MRLEQLTAKALDAAKGDRYLLAITVAKRADELAQGASSELKVDFKKFKYADLALMELAGGHVKIKGLQEKI